MKSWFKPDSWAILFGMMNFWLLYSHGLIKVIKQTTNGSWKNKIRCYIILCCLLRLVKSRKSKQLIREFVFFIVMWNLIISNFVWKLKNFGYYSDAWRGQIFLHKCVLHRGMGDPLSSTARWDASSSQGTIQHFVWFCWMFTNSQSHSQVDRCTRRVKCPLKEHNTMSPSGLELKPHSLDNLVLLTELMMM